ncbi:Multistep phosphorelay regulator 1 [Smittium culicis]|uniref:Multistep phosphorelay regulator 1 n=1 Tax=Smittium culicis TaxID=133412 RepID=A0A1R1X558_9FUNG|nr:Multistep phosphorelay regulator 1 [Smittium culicis]OMJ19678.1 Multistep phosphorelay regulator 1 [Smittium culicis]
MSLAMDEVPDDTGILDQEVFEQILELDDDSQDFLKGLIFNYYNQVQSALIQLENSLNSSDLAGISSIGHSLKGSSASLGLIKMREISERLQKIGDYHAEIDPNMPIQILLKAAEKELDNLHSEYKKVVQLFNYFLND